MRIPVVLGAAAALGWCLSVVPVATAQSRGGHAGGGHSSGGHAPGSHAGGSHSGGERSNGGSSRGSATAARERDGRSTVGTAVPRMGQSDLFLARPSTYGPRFAPYYSQYYRDYSQYYRVPYQYFRVPYYEGFGLGFYRSPFWPPYSYGDPYLSSFGEVYSDIPSQSVLPSAPSGNIRLIVDPVSAEVYVDGYYVGTVEDFYQSLAGLNVDAGTHRLEFRAPGYEPLVVDVKLQANTTITYRAALKREQS